MIGYGYFFKTNQDIFEKVIVSEFDKKNSLPSYSKLLYKKEQKKKRLAHLHKQKY